MTGLLPMSEIGGQLSWMFVILGDILILHFGVGLLRWLLGFVLLLLGWCSFFLSLWILKRRLRVLRSMFLPGALHGIEASFLADTGLRELRAAFVRVVWSHRQYPANSGAVLSLLDGPAGCDLAFYVVWFRFRMLRRFLAYRPGEVAGVKRLFGACCCCVPWSWSC